MQIWNLNLTCIRYPDWICFLYYYYMNDINWTPSTSSSCINSTASIQEVYSSTIAIVDASEVFLESPSDLHMFAIINLDMFAIINLEQLQKS